MNNILIIKIGTFFLMVFMLSLSCSGNKQIFEDNNSHQENTKNLGGLFEKLFLHTTERNGVLIGRAIGAFIITADEGEHDQYTLKNLGNNIKEIRNKKGISRDQLAKSVNLAPIEMKRIEDGEWLIIYPGIIKRISYELGVSSQELYNNIKK